MHTRTRTHIYLKYLRYLRTQENKKQEFKTKSDHFLVNLYFFVLDYSCMHTLISLHT